jgi:hypothetical protein
MRKASHIEAIRMKPRLRYGLIQMSTWRLHGIAKHQMNLLTN